MDGQPGGRIALPPLDGDGRQPGGLLVVHVSNRYYDLAPAVVAGAQRLGMTAEVQTFVPSLAESNDGTQASQWVAATLSPDQLAPLQADGWSVVSPADQPITDDYPDALRFTRFGSWLTAQ